MAGYRWHSTGFESSRWAVKISVDCWRSWNQSLKKILRLKLVFETDNEIEVLRREWRRWRRGGRFLLLNYISHLKL
jgi:hypothetical protein